MIRQKGRLMQDAAAVHALADRFEAQHFALSRELERVLGLSERLAMAPTTESWQGLARSAFDNELTLLRRSVAAVVIELDAAVRHSSRARETLLGRVE